jgi:hypothetical protein
VSGSAPPNDHPTPTRVSETGAVRKQYSFWPSERGFDAWDVDRLIRLSKDLPIREVRLETITEVDAVYWFPGRQKPTVRKIVEHVRLIGEVDLSYPVILGVDGRVMDGMHRIARSLLENRASVPAVRFQVQPAPDYVNGQAPGYRNARPLSPASTVNPATAHVT